MIIFRCCFTYICHLSWNARQSQQVDYRSSNFGSCNLQLCYVEERVAVELTNYKLISRFIDTYTYIYMRVHVCNFIHIYLSYVYIYLSYIYIYLFIHLFSI